MCSAGAVVCAHTLHTVGAVAGDSSTNDGDNNIGDISRVHVFFASITQTWVLFIVSIYKVLCSISRTVL